MKCLAEPNIQEFVRPDGVHQWVLSELVDVITKTLPLYLKGHGNWGLLESKHHFFSSWRVRWRIRGLTGPSASNLSLGRWWSE